jgi:serine/threonine-protein kinase
MGQLRESQQLGRYAVVRPLGHGGMGAVYLANDPVLNRQVAIKLLHHHLATDDVRARFALEARAAGALSHPNVVTVHDVGEFGGLPFIVMEYVRGDTLATIIGRRASLPFGQRIGWLQDLCAALAYAHGAGVVHRDIKPANLMIDHLGRLKVLDFGIARLAESGLTLTGATVGTPAYMAPEQVLGLPVDARTDVFAFGAVAYALFAHRPPFVGDTAHAVMRQVTDVDPPPLDTVAAVPAELARVVARALAKAPADRYPGAPAVAEALRVVRRSAVPPEADEETVLATVPYAAPVAPAGPVTPHDPGALLGSIAETPRGLAHLPLRPLAEAPITPMAAGRAPGRPVAPHRFGGWKTQAAVAVSVLLAVGAWLPLAWEFVGRRSSPPPGQVVATEAPAAQTTTAPTERAGDTAPPPVVAPAPAPAPVDQVGPETRELPPPSTSTPRTAALVERGSRALPPPSSARSVAPPASQRVPAVPPDPSPVRSPVVDVAPMMARAARAESEGRLQDALREYAAVLRLLPESDVATRGVVRVEAELQNRADRLVRRARASYEAGDYDAAMRDLEQALQSRPSHRDASEMLRRVRLARAADPGDA